MMILIGFEVLLCITAAGSTKAQNAVNVWSDFSIVFVSRGLFVYCGHALVRTLTPEHGEAEGSRIHTADMSHVDLARILRIQAFCGYPCLGKIRHKER